MIIRKLLRHRGLGINLIAGFSFLLLAVYGWGLSWREMGGYLLILLIVLGGLIGMAALCGWLLHRLTRRAEQRAAAKAPEVAEAEASDRKTADTAGTKTSGTKPGAK